MSQAFTRSIDPPPPGLRDLVVPVDLLDPETVYAASILRPPSVRPIAQPSNWELYAVGDFPVSGLKDVDSPNAIVPPDALDRFATEDMTTDADDPDLPNVWFDGRIASPGSVSRSVVLSPLKGASVAAEAGQITIANADGALDKLADDTDLTGAIVALDVGRRGAPWADFQRVATARIKQVDVALDNAVIRFEEFDTLYDSPFSDEVYRGNGDLEGGPDLVDVAKPVLLGRCFNMHPPMIDDSVYIFQVHDGALREVTAARYGGVEHTPASPVDYADLAALRAAAVATGEYATCLALGLVRMGLTAGGTGGGFQVTIDAEAAEQPSAEAAVVARWIAENAALEINATHDPAAWDNLVASFAGYEYGAYVTTSTNWRALMDDVTRSLGVYWGVNRDGEISTAWLSDPVGVAPSMTFDQHDVLRIARLGLPDGFTLPQSQKTVRYRRNWAPSTNVAAIADANEMGVEWLERTETYTFVGRNAYSPDKVETGLQTQAGATALAQRMLDLHGVQRTMISVTIPFAVGVPGELATVFLTYPRFGLNGGRYLTAVSSLEDYAAGEITLTLWG